MPVVETASHRGAVSAERRRYLPGEARHSAKHRYSAKQYSG